MYLLSKVNKNYYSYFDKETGMLFTFKENERGINNIGRAWCLSVTYAGTWSAIAIFCTQDDSLGAYKEDYKGLLWNPYDAFTEADAMICRMVSKTIHKDGYWINKATGMDFTEEECSECGFTICFYENRIYNYCPSCGSRNRRKKAEVLKNV